VPEFQSQFLSVDHFESKPLNGVKVGIIRETLEDGVDSGVRSATQEAASHLEALGCILTEVIFTFPFVSVFLFRFCVKILRFVAKIYRSPFLHSLLDYQLTTLLPHRSHLRIYHVMMVSGNLGIMT